MPADLKYAQTHEWVRVENNEATIGISDHAQSELGDVVYVELPQIGAKLTKGQVFGTIESVKTVSDLIAPVSGEVAKVNDGLSNAPEVINEDPLTSGWLIAVNIADISELDELMSTEQYKTFIQEH
ncbi:MAG TPA: glycine cleavage system protein GcvH [Armatimonadota bacterium]